MAVPQTIELTELFPTEALQRLEKKANQQNISVMSLIRQVLQDYLDDDEPFEETSDEAIEQGFLQGWHDAMTGKTRPIADILREIQQNANDNQD